MDNFRWNENAIKLALRIAHFTSLIVSFSNCRTKKNPKINDQTNSRSSSESVSLYFVMNLLSPKLSKFIQINENCNLQRKYTDRNLTDPGMNLTKQGLSMTRVAMMRSKSAK